MADDRPPESLTVRELKSRLTEADLLDALHALGSAPKKHDLVELYKRHVTPKKAAPSPATAPRTVTRTDEKKAGIQHMYDSPAERAPPSKKSSRQPQATPARSPSVTADNLFQRRGSATRRPRSVSVAPHGSEVESEGDGTVEQGGRPGGWCPWWTILVIAGALLAAVGLGLRRVDPCASGGSIAVPHGRCLDGELVCDADAYMVDMACVPDVPYDTKVEEAAVWVRGVLADYRGRYDCGEVPNVALDPKALAADMARTFRISDNPKPFFDDAVAHANGACNGCIKRGSGVFVEAVHGRKSLRCRVSEGLRYVIWLCLGVVVTATALYGVSHQRAQRRQAELELEEVVTRLRNGALASRQGAGYLVVDYVKEEWRDVYASAMVDEAVEILRGDARLRVKKKLVHGVERRVIEWLDINSPAPSRPATPSQQGPATPSLYPSL